MGYELMGRGKRVDINIHGYRRMLELAEDNGWVPAGTKCPWSLIKSPIWEEGYDKWSGTYFSNDMQLVEEEDAKSLASALKSALPSINDERWASKVKDFIELCEAGDFEIW